MFPRPNGRGCVAIWFLPSPAREGGGYTFEAGSIGSCQAPGFVQRAAANPARSGRKQR